MTWNPFSRIARPAECHGVETPDAYRDWQAAVIFHNRTKLPKINWRNPFVSLASVAPFVNGGRWGIHCPDCGNLAIYDPDWQLACCAECGARFESIPPPAECERIEAILLARDAMRTRNWNVEYTLGVGPAETVADLEAQNREQGEEVPE